MSSRLEEKERRRNERLRAEMAAQAESGISTFDEYQHAATLTAVYPGQGEFMGLAYAALGLNGEAGEASEQIKKAWRTGGVLTPERRQKMLDELGDTLWYMAQLCTEVGASLSEVAAANVIKLAERQAGGELKERAT